MSICNWPLAIKTLTLASESHLNLYGSGDKRVSKLKSMLQRAAKESNMVDIDTVYIRVL